MSTTLVDQLKLPYTVLEKVLPLQLAVSGSRSAIKCTVTASFAYQGIKSERLFDVANLDSYGPDSCVFSKFLVNSKNDENGVKANDLSIREAFILPTLSYGLWPPRSGGTHQ